LGFLLNFLKQKTSNRKCLADQINQPAARGGKKLATAGRWAKTECQ